MRFEEFEALENEQPDVAATGDHGFDIGQYTRLILGRWRLILLITVLGLALALGQFLATESQYQAATTIQIEQRSLLSVSGTSNPWLEAWAGMKYYPTQYRLLRSRGLAERVVRNLRLDEDPLFNPGGDHDLGDELAPGADDRAVAGLANKLLAGLSVSPVGGTELVNLSYVSTDPELAARIVNGVADTFIDWGIETRSETVSRASGFLADQVDSLKRGLEAKEQRLREYGLGSDIGGTDAGTSVTLQRLERLNGDRSAATANRLEREARYRQLIASGDAQVAALSSSSIVSQLTQELLRKEREYEVKLQTYKPDWPEMVELQGEIERGRRSLAEAVADEADRVRRAAYAELQTAIRQEQSLANEIERVKQEAADLGAVSVEYKNLGMEVENERKLLDQLLQRLSETGVSASLTSTRESNVRVVDRALVPGAPFRPSLENNLTVGGSAGMMLGIGLVLLLHLLDRTVKSAAELERLLELPVLAVIPDMSESGRSYGYGYGYGRRRRKKGKPESGGAGDSRPTTIELVPESRPRIGVSEAYRALRTALLLSTAGGLRTVTITSAEVAEGKTATAVNLAVVMAQLGRKVLLVDADLRKARLHRVLKVSNRVGLVNFLTEGGQLERCLHATAVPNLTLCPSGPHPPNPSELLASDPMLDFVQEARQRFDFVIIDSPPVLAVTDAILTGKLSDGVLLCFRAGKVLREEARSCRDRLRMANVRILGMLLNRYQPRRGRGADRRYYYYASYESYSEEQTAVDSAA